MVQNSRNSLNVDTVQVPLTPTPNSSTSHFPRENRDDYQFLVSPSRDLMLIDAYKYLWKLYNTMRTFCTLIFFSLKNIPWTSFHIPNNPPHFLKMSYIVFH